MPVSKKPRAKSKADTKTVYLIGTSLVPKGLLRQEQLDKEARSIAKYRKDMFEERDVIKRRNITRVPVELRVAFIPFTRRPEEGKKPLPLHEAAALHQNNIDKTCNKILADFKKKHNERDYQITDILDVIKSFGKSSIKHK